MRIRFWGVRGSIASPGKETSIFGGNTSCVEVEDGDGQIFIFDAGTGLRQLGLDLLRRKITTYHLLISHSHWDHIQGFPFFSPAYLKGTKINIYGPAQFDKSLKKVLNAQMDYSYFPVSMQQLNAEIEYHELKEQTLKVGNTEIVTLYANHPVTGLCYKLINEGKRVVYTGDTEPYYNLLKRKEDLDKPTAKKSGLLDSENIEEMDKIVAERNECHRNFCVSDILIHDAQFTAEEYPRYMSWGHSSMEHAIEVAKVGGVKKLILTHHDPGRTDSDLQSIEDRLKKTYPECDFIFSREGLEISI